MTRPIPTSYYYSGQGRLLIGKRNATTGAGENFIAVGNVTSLTVDIATTKFEHKESMSGNRSIDATVITEQKGTFKFSTESLSLDNLALGLYGTKLTTTSGAVTAETHTYEAGHIIALKKPKVSAVIVKVGATTCVLGTDYDIDTDFGTIYPIATSTLIVDAAVVSVDYTAGAVDRMDAFTTGTAPERFLRFEGLNTYDGKLVLLEVFRAAVDPMTGLEYINQDFGKADFSGNILLDSLVTGSGSKYFREYQFAGT
jgi:hypothetical protein